MINNPRKMNTMSANVNAGVLQALEMCADDKTVRVVVFTGAGDRAFCAGGNLEGGGASSGFRGQKGADKPPPTVRGAVRNLRHIATTSLILHNSHFVSVAAVNGACAGAGLSWACVRVSSSFFFSSSYNLLHTHFAHRLVISVLLRKMHYSEEAFLRQVYQEILVARGPCLALWDLQRHVKSTF